MYAIELEGKIQCLAMNIYFESDNSVIDAIAIAQTTVNRARINKTNVCKEVYRRTKKVCQFSWVCNKRKVVKNKVKYFESIEVAKLVYVRNFGFEELSNAYFFHANYINPKWKYKRIGNVGSHVFYHRSSMDRTRVF